MNESGFWGNRVRPAMSGLDPVRIEGAASGTPDVNYTNGWIELKYLKKWPTNPQKVVKIDHFTPEQRLWLMRRTLAGGKAFLLIGVGRESLLFEGDVASEMIGKIPRAAMYVAAHAVFRNREELINDLHTYL